MKIKILHYRLALIIFMLLLIIFVSLLTAILLWHEHKLLIKQARVQAEKRLDLVEINLRESFLKQDYDNIEVFLQKWTQEEDAIVFLRVVAANGFVIFDYQKPYKNKKFLASFQKDIFYANTALAQIYLEYNFNYLQLLLKEILFLVFPLVILGALIIGFLLWLMIKALAIIPLQINHEFDQAINALLTFSLKNKGLDDVLKYAIEKITAISFLHLEKKAAILLFDEKCSAIEHIVTQNVSKQDLIDYDPLLFDNSFSLKKIKVFPELFSYVIPLVAQDKLLGLILLSNPYETHRQEFFFKAIANVLALIVARKKLEAEIQKINQELEERVEERTQELSVLNIELEKKNQTLQENVELRDDIEQITRHDLKAPLNSIIGIPQVLKEDDNLTHDQKEMLQALEDVGYQMLNMVSLSMDLYKMEKKNYSFTPDNIDILIVIRKVVKDLSNLLRAKKIDIKINVKNSIYIYAEELLCYSMLANLIKNAIEASPCQETIIIHFGTSNTHQIISITNQGIVPEEIKSRFFDKYITFGKRGGTGLGTYSARLMAEVQKGKLILDMSNPKQTTIYIYLLKPRFEEEHNASIKTMY